MSAGAVPCLAACMGQMSNTSSTMEHRQYRQAGRQAGRQAAAGMQPQEGSHRKAGAGRQACLIESLEGTKLQVSQPVEASLFTMPLGRVRPLTALACTEVDQPEACFREQALV